MLVLSLYQPWATLAVIGAKRIETRSWPTHHRGELGIHATQSFPGWAQEFSDTPTVQGALDDFGHNLMTRESRCAWDEWFPTGAILGTVSLTDCLSTNQGAEIDGRGTLPPLAGTLENMVGDFSRDRFMWLLEKPEPFFGLIPARGHQRLWHFPNRVQEAA